MTFQESVICPSIILLFPWGGTGCQGFTLCRITYNQLFEVFLLGNGASGNHGIVIHKIMGMPIPNVLSWTVKCINNILPKILKIHFYLHLTSSSVKIACQILNLTHTSPFSSGGISSHYMGKHACGLLAVINIKSFVFS